MKNWMWIVAQVFLLNAHAGPSDSVASQVEAWYPKFKQACVKAIVKNTPVQAERESYCGCIKNGHKRFLESKRAAGEPIHVDRYLSKVLSIYQSPEKVDESKDGAGVVDVEVDIAEACAGGESHH